MLKGSAEPQNLTAKRDELFSQCETSINELILTLGDNEIEYLNNEQSININYPVNTYPEKVKSFNFDKTAEISGVLNGIKGQYLILDSGVLNMRKFGGYQLTLEA